MKKYLRCLPLFITTLICFSIVVSSFLVKDAADETLKVVNENMENYVELSGKYEKAWQPYSNLKIIADSQKILDVQQKLKSSYDVQNCIMRRLYLATFNDGRWVDTEHAFFDDISESFINGTENEYFLDPANAETIERYLSADLTISVFGDNKTEILFHKYGNKFRYYRDEKIGAYFDEFSQDDIDNGTFICYVPRFHTIYKSPEIKGQYDLSIDSREAVYGDEIILAEFFSKDGKIVHVEPYRFIIKGTYYTPDSADDDYGIVIPQSTLNKIEEKSAAIYKEYNCNTQDSSSRNIYDRVSLTSKTTYASKAVVMAKTIDDIDDIISYIKSECGDVDGLKLQATAKEYDLISAPSKNLLSISNIIFMFSIVVTALLLALVVFINTRNRKVETGIYLSLGESKKNIARKYITEILVIATISLIISLGVGTYVSKSVINKNIKNYKLPKEVATSDSMVKTQNLINKVEVSLDARAIIVTCISCYGAAVISTLVSTNIVMKSSPKELLIKE